MSPRGDFFLCFFPDPRRSLQIQPSFCSMRLLWLGGLWLWWLCVVGCGLWRVVVVVVYIYCVSCRLMQLVYYMHIAGTQNVWMHLFVNSRTCCSNRSSASRQVNEMCNQATKTHCEMCWNISSNKDQFSPVATLSLLPFLVGLSACRNGLLRDRFERSAGKPTSPSLSSCFFFEGHGEKAQQCPDQMTCLTSLEGFKRQGSSPCRRLECRGWQIFPFLFSLF